MHKCSPYNNPNCDSCRLTEDNPHLFTKCTRIQNTWNHYQPCLTKLTGKTNKPQEHLITINIRHKSNNTRKLILTIIQIILYETWQSRNNNKYDNITLTTKTIIREMNK